MALISNWNVFLICSIVVLLLPAETYAFGAGDIPDFSYLNDKAFRHGDIENILETLIKSAGGLNTGGGLLSLAHSLVQTAAGGAKFTKSDVKKVYFGNWLRDYSQAMDIAGLSKLTADTLILVVSVLGFMTFGFATEEFQVTADRLGVYLPVEHIDNPKGYAAKEGDARQFHPKLRPPVDNRELEIDQNTGMKNYMATEGQGWDTSTAFIRRTFRACIEAGRRAGGNENADLWEAYRLLGTGLHTMEDLLAHSNWCEVALRKLGHEEVFCHVGDDVMVDSPNGPAPPLVTGTFGSADFIYSLMGEATDHLSQASVTDLSQRIDQASGSEENLKQLKDILGKLPAGGGEDKVNQTEQMQAQAKAYNFNPDDVAPPEVQKQLLDLLKWRDGIYRDVVAKIEMVPGLSDLLDELTNALNAYVYTIISPYVAPILQQATGVLGAGSKAVIDSDDQYEVFDNPNASDPSHSILSKDHFDLILNEPAGQIAQLVVQNSVNLIVQAWADGSDPDEVINRILEAFHHPYYATGQSNIQHQMFERLSQWIGGLGQDRAGEVIQRLTKESVREGHNKRPESESQPHDEPGYGRSTHGGGAHRPSAGGGYQGQSGYSSNQYGSGNQHRPGQYESGNRYESGNQRHSEHSYSSGNQSEAGNRYGSGNQYNSENQHGSGNQYGSRNQYGSGNQYSSDDQYGSGRRNQEQGGYDTGARRNEDSYGSGTYGESGYGSRRSYDNQYTSGRDSQGGGYGSVRSEYESGDNRYESEQRRSGYDGEGYGTRRSEYQGSQDYRRGGSQSDSYGGNQGGGYGGGGGYGERRQEGYESDDEYGRRRDDNDDDDRRREHHHSSRGDGGGYAPSYEQPSGGYQSYNSGGNSGYGGGRVEERSYGSSEYNRSGGDYGQRDYGRDDREETFGAERLRVNDSDEEEEKRRRRHHHKRDSD